MPIAGKLTAKTCPQHASTQLQHSCKHTESKVHQQNRADTSAHHRKLLAIANTCTYTEHNHCSLPHTFCSFSVFNISTNWDIDSSSILGFPACLLSTLFCLILWWSFCRKDNLYSSCRSST